ncbi:Telomerase reverse transcriptase [Cryptotrichosporon argae]
MSISPIEVRHKTLSHFYPRLCTLQAHLAPLAVPDLVLSSDLAVYKALLDRTLCAPHAKHACGPWPPAGHSEGTQQEAIDLVLNRVGKGNVLVIVRGSGTWGVNPTRPGLNSADVSSVCIALREVEWRLLRARIGNAAFSHLLLTTSIFVPLANNSYLQLAGPAIHDMPQLTSGCVDDAALGQASVTRKRKREAPDACASKRSKLGKARKTAAEVVLARGKMFYGRPNMVHGRFRDGLPSSHPLNKNGASDGLPDDEACERILRAVFPDERMLRNQQRRVQVLGVMRELLLRHARIDYGRLLRLCVDRGRDPEVVRLRKVGKKRAHALCEEPLRPIWHTQVCRFVTSVLRRVVSPAIMGGDHNFSVLASNARRLVRAKLHEPLTLHTAVQDLRVNDIAWLGLDMTTRINAAEAAKRRELAEAFVYWLLDGLIIPLIRASFYVTETAETRYETVYFAHRHWARATSPHFKLLQGALLSELDKGQQDAVRQGPLGVSAVRLIPKPNGFRPIVNLGRPIKAKNANGAWVKLGRALSANGVLRPVHHVLTYEKARHKDELGSALFGTNEIFAPIQQLKRELIRSDGSLPRLYFAKMDIKAAFDTIEQDKMVRVVERLMADKSYWTGQYAVVLPPGAKGSGEARRLYKMKAVGADALWQRAGEAASNLTHNTRNAVVVDLARRSERTQAALMELVRTHIKRNVWQIGDKLFRQKTGIPQGSIISSLLCSFFYADLEREHLDFVHRPGTRLLRYIDDFLLVTDDYAVARRFVDTMLAGFPAYGAFVSPSKTLVSFEHAGKSGSVPVCAIGARGLQIPYCGYMIDGRTLDLSIDVCRMIATPARHTFAVRTARRRGATFVGWLCRQLENRNHVAFLDTAHNARTTVYETVYTNFALAAMKVPHYFSRADPLDARRADMIADAIVAAVEYTYVAGRARVRHASGTGAVHFDIRKRVFTHLAVQAVRKVLGRRGRWEAVVARLADKARRTRVEGDAEVATAMGRGWDTVRAAKF